MKAKALSLFAAVVLAVVLGVPVASPGPRMDGWEHVLSRIAVGGDPNPEGLYAQSYTRRYRMRSDKTTSILLVEAPDRELSLAQALLAQGFVREAAFHARCITEFQGDSSEAPAAREILEACTRKSAFAQFERGGQVLREDTGHVLLPVDGERSGITRQDVEAIADRRYEEVARRHPGTPIAFALYYQTGQFRKAIALAHLPALPVEVPAGDKFRLSGRIDDGGIVVTPAVTRVVLPPDPPTVVEDDEEIPLVEEKVEVRVPAPQGTLFFRVDSESLPGSEREYKRRFLDDAARELGETPEIQRLREYFGLIPPSRPRKLGELDLAYERALAGNPYVKVEVPSILTTGRTLLARLTTANVESVRFRFCRIEENLPREEAGLKDFLDSRRERDLPVAYEETFTVQPEVQLPIREIGVYRVTAEAADLKCTFFAVRSGARIEALCFPSETIVIADRVGLDLSVGGRLLGETDSEGMLRVGRLGLKYCAEHESCCEGCDSCAHHHSEPFSPASEFFGCDGRSFFRAKMRTDLSALSKVKVPSLAPTLFVYTDRPVYRAGDVLKFRGILRSPRWKIGRGDTSRFTADPGQEVVVSVEREQGTLFKRTYVTGEEGTFAGEFALPLSTSRAEYALIVSCNQAEAKAPFEVMDYRKTEYVVTLTPDAEGLQVKAGYAWGAPVEGARLQAWVRNVEIPIVDGRIRLQDGETARVALLRGDEELASKSATCRKPRGKEPEERVQPPQEAGGKEDGPSRKEPTGESGDAPVAPLRASKRFYERGDTIELEIRGADGDALVALGDVQAYDWQRVTIREGRGVARFPVTGVLDPGTTAFAVIGGKVERLPIEVNSQRMKIEIVPDKTQARPGEEVGVTIKTLPEAALSVAAVDEAVYMIREDATPEMYGSFYLSRPAEMVYAVLEEYGYPGECREDEHPPAGRGFFAADEALERAALALTCLRGNLPRDVFMRRGMAYGGGARATETAVLGPLRTLANMQRPDGSWAGDEPTEWGRVDDVGGTSLCLLAFLGAGYTHMSREKYGDISIGAVVKEGLQYLTDKPWPRSGDWVLNHALAALALSEAYGMTQSATLREPAERAIGAVCASQTGDGGWHPAGGPTGETPTSAVAVMVLTSARCSDLLYPPAAASGALRYFRAVMREDGTCAMSRRPGAETTTFASACGLASMIFLRKQKGADLQTCAARLASVPLDASRAEFASWYMTAIALFQFDGPDGPEWKAWNAPLRDTLNAAETKKPAQIALKALSFEVYYRYKSTFGAGASEDPRPLAVEPAIRVYFPDTALWIPELMTDRGGTARATVRMPDSITTLRLTSRGATRDSAVGEGVGRIESRQPFFVNLKSPAFFVTGDEAEIRAELFNYTGGVLEVTVALSGNGFAHVGEASHRVAVGDSCESVSWRVRVTDRERVRFLVDTGRDAMEKIIPVTSATPPVTRFARGPRVVVPPGETPLDLVVRILPKGSALSRILEALRYLNDYPHG